MAGKHPWFSSPARTRAPCLLWKGAFRKGWPFISVVDILANSPAEGFSRKTEAESGGKPATRIGSRSSHRCRNPFWSGGLAIEATRVIAGVWPKAAPPVAAVASEASRMTIAGGTIAVIGNRRRTTGPPRPRRRHHKLEKPNLKIRIPGESVRQPPERHFGHSSPLFQLALVAADN